MTVSAGSVWENFPTAASPRPVVLLSQRVQTSGGFVDGQAKLAAVAGSVHADVPLPPGVLELIQRGGRGAKVAPIHVTGIEATSAAFLCDRGPRELPAYRLTVSGLRGHLTVLDPEVECWWPPPGEDPSSNVQEAQIDSDGLTIHFPAFGGVLTDFIRAEFTEHDTYVIGRAVTEERPSTDPVILIGLQRLVVGRLEGPLGGRVLINEDGHPVMVTPS